MINILNIKSWFKTYAIYILAAIVVSLYINNTIQDSIVERRDLTIRQLKIDLKASELNSKIKEQEGKNEARKDEANEDINTTLSSTTFITGPHRMRK